MALIRFDARGMRCPHPILGITMKVLKKEVNPGDILEVTADCPTFQDDVKKWCTQSKKALLYMRDEAAGVKRCQIQI